ncbi:hypothetical protein [Cryobacterium sp. PAMC25264]|uniref:hypothetical protein n=1 Tax=Cryobacterium sp. PAMC25264 TaxID=2861288 RepID=UPI001C631402|nr:hypothetical protein [Cryobacterium sp. PAMC25264]QYF74177.1 hypothetical protein KY500_02775 [Cryobacterium sp. PAMC25264]
MRTPRRPGNPLLAVSLLTVTALLLSGCAPASPAPPVSESATPPATVNLTPAAPAAPAQLLDGDCSALATDDAVSALLGTVVSAQTGFVDEPSANAVTTIGGIQCRWAEPAGVTGVTGASLTTVMVGSDAVETTPDAVECSEASFDASGALASTCSFSVSSGSVWLSGVAAMAAGADEEDARAAVAAVGDIIRALPAPRPVGPSATARVWTATGCADLSARAGLPDLLDSPGLRVDDADSSGGQRAAGNGAALAATGFFGCSWYHDGDTPSGEVSGFTSEALPGGAWAQTQVLVVPGATVVDLAGVDLAVRVPMDEEVTGVAEVLNVFDGANWLQVSGAGELSALEPAVVALVAALNAG